MNDRPNAIFARFPEYRKKIERYINENEEFESLCSDYDQCISMLKLLQANTADFQEYVEIKLELEHEILKYLL